MSELVAVPLRRSEAPRRAFALAAAYLSAMGAIIRRDASVMLSYRMTLISSNLGIIFSLALFYFISQLVRVPPFQTDGEYFAFAVVGIVIFGVARSSLGVPQGLRQELVAGTYERLVLSPFGGTAGIVALMLFPMLYALITATFELGVAAAIFGVDVHWGTAAAAIPIGVLGALAFAPFALTFAAITLAFKQVPGQSAVLALVSLVSGLYFPVSLLPWWLEWLSKVQPFTPTVDLMRNVLVGLPMPGSFGLALLKLVGFALVGVPVGVFFVRIAGWYSRKRGTVIEY
jgi:ABC-2 type transport system permease protein